MVDRGVEIAYSEDAVMVVKHTAPGEHRITHVCALTHAVLTCEWAARRDEVG